MIMTSDNDHPKPEVGQERQMERLADLLEFEINRLETEQKRPGWTKWGLAGAMGGALWLLIGLYESQAVRIQQANVLFLVLTMAVFWDVLLGLKRLLSLSFPRPQSKPRFLFTSVLFEEIRILFAVQFLKNLGFFLIAISSPLVPKDWLGTTIYIVLATSLLPPLIGLATSYGRFPVPLGQPKQAKLAVWATVLGLFLVALIFTGLARSALLHAQSITTPELRIAALVMLILLLLPIFLTDRAYLPFLSTLLDLRRKLALGQITYEFGKRQTDIIFEGMDVAEMLRADADTCLARCREAIVSLDELSAELQAIETGQASERATKPTTAEKLELIKVRLKATNGLLDKADAAARDLRGQAGALIWLAPTAGEETQKLLGSVDMTVKQTKAKTLEKQERAQMLLRGSESMSNVAPAKQHTAASTSAVTVAEP
jgi:hypothetical protein